MSDVVSFREGGFRVEAGRAEEAPLRRHVLPDPAAALARGEPVKRNNYRAAARIEVPGVGALLLKVHRPRGFADTVRAALRRSRARAEWDAARYLLGAGVPTPVPVLCAERRRGLRLESAAYASRFLAARETFAPALASQPPDKARALLVRASRLLRALHDRGVSHGDFHSGNVLVGPGPGDRCRLDVIDLHTARTARDPSRRRRLAQLAQWLHSLLGVVGPGGRHRALVGYLGDDVGPGRSRALVVAARRLRRLVAARERRRRRSRGRRCVEEGQTYTRVRPPACGALRGWRRRDAAPDALDAALKAHDVALAAGGAAVLKAGRKSAVTRAGGFVVKEARLTAARRWLARLAPRRLRAGYEHAHRLGVVGVPTAPPVAFLRGGGRVFTVYQDLTACPRLDLRVRDALRGGAWSSRRRREVLLASADFLARAHRLGVWHGDAKGCNWLLDERGSTPRFFLVDTDRVRFLRRVGRGRRLRNVAQLAASIPRAVTRTDRLRWWRRYVRGTPLAGREAERAAARDVAGALARKTVVVDDPIE